MDEERRARLARERERQMAVLQKAVKEARRAGRRRDSAQGRINAAEERVNAAREALQNAKAAVRNARRDLEVEGRAADEAAEHAHTARDMVAMISETLGEPIPELEEEIDEPAPADAADGMEASREAPHGQDHEETTQDPLRIDGA